jgi:hypothetical protein
MPLFIRPLPCKSKGAIIDKKSVPPGIDLYNPSRADTIIYIRKTARTGNTFINSAVLHDSAKQATYEIDSPWALLKPCDSLFKGVEDLRIVRWNSDLWFAGTCTHASSHLINDLIVGKFDKALSKVETLSVVDICSLPVKNVCPFVYRDQLCLLDIGLMKIYELGIDEDNGEISVKHTVPLSWGTSGLEKSAVGGADKMVNLKLRGSTSPVHLHGNVWGCVAHDIIFNNSKALVTRLSYLHHWIEFDISTGLVSFVSTPFWILHWGIEYVSGIHMDATTKGITLYFGVNDEAPMQCETTLSDLRCGY